MSLILSPSHKNPEPIKKLSTHKDSVSTAVKIGVSCLATGILPTVTGIAISAATQKTVEYAKDWGNS